jgi:hypothetical protein
MLKVLDLPRKYEYKEGESRPEYKKYSGWNKVSYSQITSFVSDEYRGDYFSQYFMEIKDDGNIFSFFGSACGDYLNRKDQRVDEYLEEKDKGILDAIKQPKESEYEFEILIDLEKFGLKETVLQGFSDIQYEVGPKLLNVHDYKTLTLDKKRDFYSSEDYQQLNVYGYGLEELGYKINKTSVFGLGRSGNTTNKDAVNKKGEPLYLRLSGEVEEIRRDYNRVEAEEYIKKIAKICVEISNYFKIYKKYFG